MQARLREEEIVQNETMIAGIREGGIAQGAKQAEDRNRRLQEVCGFRMAETAEYALIAGCFSPYLEPQDMTAFRKLLDHFGVDYTLLPKEYCCGDLFFVHALHDEHEGDLEQADDLGREFLDQNLEQARELGASKILAYCAGCDMAFNRVDEAAAERIVWHPTLLARLFQGGKLDLQADYYSGCHRHRRKLMGTTPDLDSVTAALSKIDGLELHHLDSELCCMEPDQLESLASSVKHKTVIAPCSGCTLSLRRALAARGEYRVSMLSEVMWAAVDGHEL
jgi:Fe-S oxidoreductase